MSEEIEKLIAKLQSANGSVRYEAVQELQRMFEAAAPALPALIVALKDTNTDARREVPNAIGRIGAKALPAVPALAEALEDDDNIVRIHAAEALKTISEKVGFKARAAVPALIIALKDEDSRVMVGAAWALGLIGDDAAIPALVEALAEEEKHPLDFVVGALKRFGDKPIPYLIAALKHENDKIRKEAATLLGEVGIEHAEEIVPALVKARGDKEYGVSDAVEKSLKSFGADTFLFFLKPGAIASMVAILREVLKSPEEQMRIAAAEAIANLGKPARAAVPDLINALKDPSLRVRYNAIYALGCVHSKEAVKPLIALLSDTDEKIRSNAIYALGQLRSKEAVKPLIALLSSEDENLQSAAQNALIATGPAAMMPLAAELAKNPDLKFVVEHIFAKIKEAMDHQVVETGIVKESRPPNDVRHAIAEATPTVPMRAPARVKSTC